MAMADMDAALTGAPAARRGAWALAMVAALAGLSLVQRWLAMPNADVAWLLTVAERMLDGQRLYVDIVETNPPFSVWLYLPPVWLARATGLSAEVIWDGMIFVGAGLSLAATFSTLHRGALLDPRRSTASLAVLTAVLLLLPAACFGEREHVALILFLPVAAHAAARARGHDLSTGERWLSAVCLGLVLIIKPHFALALAPVLVIPALTRSSWRLLLVSENFAAAGLFIAYVASTAMLHPAFWSQAMPLNTALYLPVRMSTVGFLTHFISLEIGIAAILLMTALKRTSGWGDFSSLLACAACGFYAAAVMQGKGMAYHFYPALALAVAVPFAARAPAASGLQAPRLVAVLMAGYFWTWLNSGFDFRHAIEATRAAAPHPRVLSLGSDFSIGPPVARAAGGVYVGRVSCQWIADFAAWLRKRASEPREAASYESYMRQDRDYFMQDLLTQKPDVLFIQRGPEDWTSFAEADPRFASAMRSYERGGTFASGGMRNAFVLTYDMWVRRR